ncbi:MAG: Na+ dependent nucleoside transporter [Bacteroidales bacterium]|nr:Na+ dependent nucleoside transporter [Bacteroidales bacterium]MCF8350004.1 Na+ dependent nucleoside transporter [Bacteroidales bacterium]MCF8376367.1 Na+ dependent nucleoside transporter [Bacteroidales bacterium]MCF8400533.1 Na+ dependent nucleoside transporter [Bacteroidales bacterium]
MLASEADTGFGFNSLWRGVLGLITVVFIAFVFSSNRRAIQWRVVITGLFAQVIIAIGVLKVAFIQSMIEFIGRIFIKVLAFTKVGSEFIFGNLLDMESFGVIFAFQILPTILFFSALTSILFYYGIIQKIVYALAWLLTKALKISGAESLSAAGNIFLGQTESPLLIKEYLKKMNKSEIMLVMVGGMATIAGGVLAIYIGLLGGDDPAEQLLFAKHLITASVMAAPGAVVAAKILVPQTEPIESKIEISKENVGSNFLDAISNGTVQGVKLAVNVAAMLIVFLALIAMFNFILKYTGGLVGLNEWVTGLTNGQYENFSLQFILGYIFAPVAWAIGVPGPDMTLVAQLFGEKIILNEMIAYKSMKDLIDISAFTYEKSVIISTYILCGFANFGSVGIQIGGIGALAPNKKTLLSKLGFKALLGGALASLLSATIVGMIIG